jgi:predicted transcriptional regulator
MSSSIVEPGPEVLTKMRKVMGLRLAQVAQATGININTISRFERGLEQLSPEEIKAIADYIAEVSLERSERDALPAASDVGLDSRKRGQAQRQRRLAWGVKLYELSTAARMQQNLISMFEHGYVELDDEEFERVTEALTALIDRKNSQLAWYANPAELEKRRTALGITRKRLARRFGRTESWVVGLESGTIALTEEISTPIWEYIAGIEIDQRKQQGHTAELRAALSAPVAVEEGLASASHLTAEEPSAAGVLCPAPPAGSGDVPPGKELAGLRKVNRIQGEMYRNSEQARVILSHIVEGVGRELAVLKEFTEGGMAPGRERDELSRLVKNIEDVINE